MIVWSYRAIRGKRRRRRSERAQFRDTLRSCAKSFIGGFESEAGKRFVEAMTDAARARGKPLGGGPRQLTERQRREVAELVEKARRTR